MMDYNGTEIEMAAFYTVQNNKAYVLTAIIPTSKKEQKSEEVRQITQSFILDGFNPSSASKALVPQSSNQNNSGARPSRNTQTATKNKTAGKYYLISRSDNKSLTDYHFIDIKSNGTYMEEYMPNNSGNYVSRRTGIWKKNNGRIILYFNDGTESGKYILEGNDLTRWSDNKTMFRFRK